MVNNKSCGYCKCFAGLKREIFVSARRREGCNLWTEYIDSTTSVGRNRILKGQTLNWPPERSDNVRKRVKTSVMTSYMAFLRELPLFRMEPRGIGPMARLRNSWIRSEV